MATQTQSFLQGEMVDEKYALVRYLGGSNHSSVFLTQYGGVHPKDAAIKLTPAPPGNAEARLSGWRLAANVSHPHLVRILDMGRCEVGNAAMLYVVTELADENLAQILPERPLTAEEARDMLASLLDALVFLHSRGFVHGHIKPSNIMAVGEQLKLSSDGICRLGEVVGNGGGFSVYDAPEGNRGGASTAGDIWSLGVTLVEALTQEAPEWTSSDRRDPVPPETMPAPFPEIVRHCLRREPKNRWPAATIQAHVPRTVAAPARTPAVEGERVTEAEETKEAKTRPSSVVDNFIGKGPAVLAAASAAGRTLRAKGPVLVAAANASGRALRAKGAVLVAAARAGIQKLREKWPAIQSAVEGVARDLRAKWPVVRDTASAAMHTLRKKRYALGAAAGVIAIVLAAVMLIVRINAPATPVPTPRAEVASAPPPPRTAPLRKRAQFARTGRSAAATQRAQASKRLAATPAPAAPRPERVVSSPQVSAKQVPPTIPAAAPLPSAAASGAPASSTGELVSGRVVQRVTPDVPRQASNTIWGTVRVAVRVSVDALGNVTQAELQTAGPSRYFARLSVEAARQWRFAAPTENGHAVSSVWLLHFGYRRDGTAIDPSQIQP